MIYICINVAGNGTVRSHSDYSILGLEIARVTKRFYHPLLAGKPTNIAQSIQDQRSFPVIVRH